MKRRNYARILLLIMILNVMSSLPAYALTGGPTQPEFQSFEPATTSEMVNLPDGGFTYNLPLMDVGGYPLNLSYHSDISADMEASCVGLGWSINPGVINRNVRALPDDFNGDEIIKEFSLKPNTTFGATLGASLELFGMDFLKAAKMNLGLSMGVFYNNYWGIGYEFGVSPSVSAGTKGGGKLTAGIGLNVNSQSGANFSPNLGYSMKMEEANGHSNYGLGASLSTQINSREGLRATTLSANASRNIEQTGDKDNSSAGTSSSATFDYAGKTFTPEFQMPQNNVSVSVNIKPGGVELFGTNVALDVTGYFSLQYLRNNLIRKQAFGLLYSEVGANNLHALMDFNREKDGTFHDYSINLPLVNPGYDVLSVNGQGIGGSFQLKRGDVPVFFDAQSVAEGYGGSLGLELGTGNTAHGGVDLKFNYSNSTSKKWTSGNQVLKKYNFRAPSATVPVPGYEPSYYKAAGEMAVESDSMYYKYVGKDHAVTAQLMTAGSPFNVETLAGLKSYTGGGVPSPGSGQYVQRTKRERRNQVISYLTADEASKVGLEMIIKSYKYNDFTYPQIFSTILRNSDKRKGHHISQVESFQPDGMRYVYGIPAYNLVQKEVSFSVGETRTKNCDRGTVTYAAGENSKGNDSGQEKYFSSVETPGFAHSYLLTAVLGKDYEDITGNGPTPDDFGSYTKINYTRIETGGDEKYHWRVPFGRNEANYNAGYYSKDFDDKGTYIYGEKEIWLVHSIESKTMVAEFEYADRLDGYGVIDENGGRAAANFNKKLVKITLYSRPDRIKNTSNAVPIKTVHFDYDYTLCPGTDNSKIDPTNPNGGKLTLTKLYFTYGLSKKGSYSTYRFAYKQTGPLASYNSKAFDRWGNFMPDKLNLTCWNPPPSSPLSNDEFPYAEQDKQLANDNAGMWSLNRIYLPTGGEIEVDYAAKHYAYVQDMPAMKLFQIEGIGKVSSSDPDRIDATGSTLYDDINTNYRVVLFKVLPGTTKEKLKAKYLRNISLNDTYVYLKCFVKLNAGLPNKYEYVSMYSQISGYGIDANTGYGWLELKPLPTTDKNNASTMLNPITKYALQFMRENLPDIAFGQTAITENSPQNLDLFKPLAEMGHQLAQLFVGFNREMINRGYCKEIAPKRSFIRLCEPTGFKYGGGSMVKSIVIHDHWGNMTGVNPSVQYGQEYDYTMKETRQDGTTDQISSGVTSYEPMIGGDENPLKMPVVITQQRKWAVDNVHYVEEPFGEVFMPSPQVVFSKITIRNLQYANVKRTATGHSEMRYYTARDFPVKTRRTDIEKMPKRINPILGLLKVKLKEHMNAAQGFLIELNDMHAKPMSNEVFDESGTKISGVYYHYKTKSPGELDNTVEVIHASGKVAKGLLGVNYSLAGDARESITQTKSGGVAFNLDGFLVGPIPAAVPLPWPQFEQSEELFKSMAFTKVVNKFGILERTEAYDLGSTISTDNLAYDAETGEVLLTRTYNEFDDPIYNLKLPAHFAYKGMQGAYKNIGFEATATSISPVGTYQLLSPANASFFMPGDELLVSNSSVGEKAWVLNISGANLFLIQKEGRPMNLNGTVNLKVIRSGYRNMPSIPIETFTSLHNPIQGTGPQRAISFMPLTNPRPLQAEATEYSDSWQSFCCVTQVENENGKQNVINPFVSNIKGEWRPQRSWLYLTNRAKNAQGVLVNASTTNIRDNGYFEDFRSFWELPQAANPYWTKDETNWTWSALSKQVNPNGTELESQNRLGLYSAEITGYYHQLITGVASNSRYRQIAFEGFEDFDYVRYFPDTKCSLPRHFGDGYENHISDQAYHTGKYSVKVPGGSSISSTYPIIQNCPPPPSTNVPISRVDSRMGPYTINDCECIQAFSPDTGRYVLTAWVKEANGQGQPVFTKHGIEVMTGTTVHGPFKASEMIIDGWQRIEGEFTVAPGSTSIQVKLKALSGDVYFDDIRIFPFHGSMKNYVYDDVSLKLMAELDPNGYAKIYEYSPEGELIRIKQETERGIMTIQESRSSNPK